jgi:hypothetical protein
MRDGVDSDGSPHDRALARRYRLSVVCEERDVQRAEAALYEELILAGLDPRNLSFERDTRGSAVAITVLVWSDPDERARLGHLVLRLESRPIVRWVYWQTALDRLEPTPKPVLQPGHRTDAVGNARIPRWIMGTLALVVLACLLLSHHA